MIPEAAMFFAAGLGTRMAPLTDTCPKPLIEVAGKSLLDHALMQGAGVDLKRKVVNLHYRGDMIRDHLRGRDIIFTDEPGQILETGGGLRNALPHLGTGPVFTMNTDAVWRGPNSFATLAAAWDPARMDGLLLLVPPDRMVGHQLRSGFAMGPQGHLSRGPVLAYTGAQILTTVDLADIDEKSFSLNMVWDKMLARNRLFGVLYPGQWCDVGRPETLPLAEAMLRP